MATLLIIGGSSTALEIRECVDNFYKEQFSEVYNVIGDTEQTNLQSVIHDSELEAFIATKEVYYIIGFADQRLRQRFSILLEKQKKALIIHPTAVIFPSAKVGDGTYIGATAVISSNAQVGESCLINIGVSIGHDADVGKNCVVNPGARISGHCKIGERCLIGANAFIYQGISVCHDCAIDALTYLSRDIDTPSICTSNIGKLKRYKNVKALKA